jgi:hypothetical protein
MKSLNRNTNTLTFRRVINKINPKAKLPFFLYETSVSDSVDCVRRNAAKEQRFIRDGIGDGGTEHRVQEKTARHAQHRLTEERIGWALRSQMQWPRGTHF